MQQQLDVRVVDVLGELLPRWRVGDGEQRRSGVGPASTSLPIIAGMSLKYVKLLPMKSTRRPGPGLSARASAAVSSR